MLYPIGSSSVYQFVDEDPTANVPANLRKEIDLLSDVAALARNDVVTLLESAEDTLELLGILMLPSSESSVFDGIEFEVVAPPDDGQRIFGGWFGEEKTRKEDQIDRLRELRDERFLQLQRACGAYQGPQKPLQSNQLLDAYHVWCAELAGASHFLTTDLKLMRLVNGYARHPVRVKVLSPSLLLADLGRREDIG